MIAFLVKVHPWAKKFLRHNEAAYEASQAAKRCRSDKALNFSAFYQFFAQSRGLLGLLGDLGLLQSNVLSRSGIRIPGYTCPEKHPVP